MLTALLVNICFSDLMFLEASVCELVSTSCVCVEDGTGGGAYWGIGNFLELGERLSVIHLTASLKFLVIDCVCENFSVLSTTQITKDLHGQFHT